MRSSDRWPPWSCCNRYTPNHEPLSYMRSSDWPGCWTIILMGARGEVQVREVVLGEVRVGERGKGWIICITHMSSISTMLWLWWMYYRWPTTCLYNTLFLSLYMYLLLDDRELQWVTDDLPWPSPIYMYPLLATMNYNELQVTPLSYLFIWPPFDLNKLSFVVLIHALLPHLYPTFYYHTNSYPSLAILTRVIHNA